VRREIHRRRGWLGGAIGPELDDLAHQTADDAVVAIINNLDSYRGASRFTTWAYRFVMNQASIKTHRHPWSGGRSNSTMSLARSAGGNSQAVTLFGVVLARSANVSLHRASTVLPIRAR